MCCWLLTDRFLGLNPLAHLQFLNNMPSLMAPGGSAGLSEVINGLHRLIVECFVLFFVLQEIMKKKNLQQKASSNFHVGRCGLTQGWHAIGTEGLND